MTKQFKHESDGYIPLLDTDDGKLIRPYWVEDDEVLLYFPNPLARKRNLKLKSALKSIRFQKKNSLNTKKQEEFPLIIKSRSGSNVEISNIRFSCRRCPGRTL